MLTSTVALSLVGVERPSVVRYRAHCLVVAALACGFFETSKLLASAPEVMGALTAVMGVTCLALLRHPFGRLLQLLAFSLCCLLVWLTFPTTANHGYLLCYMAAIGAWASWTPSDVDKVEVLALARWLAAVVLIASGVQKIGYGAYDSGEFFALHIARGTDRFVAFWHLVLEPKEMRTVVDQARFAGVFRLPAGVPRLLSCAVPTTELFVGAALFIRAVRTHAAVAAGIFVLAIQVVTGEISFAILMVSLLTAFVPVRSAMSMTRGAVVAFLVLGLGTQLGWLPRGALN